MRSKRTPSGQLCRIAPGNMATTTVPQVTIRAGAVASSYSLMGKPGRTGRGKTIAVDSGDKLHAYSLHVSPAETQLQSFAIQPCDRASNIGKATNIVCACWRNFP